MKTATLHDLFVHELKDALSAEKQLIAALPKMSKKAQDSGLKQVLDAHFKETKGHVERLEKIFKMLDVAPRAIPCKAMQGIITEGDEGMEEADPAVIDVAITGSAARIEHYEIAAYSALIEMAKVLGQDKAGDLLKATLEEEKVACKMAETGGKMAMKAVPSGM